MGFFKSGFKGSLIGGVIAAGGAGILALPVVATTAGLTAPLGLVAVGIAALIGMLGGGMVGGAFGLATDDDEKDRDSDRDTDERIKELEAKLKEREKEKEPGLFSKIMSVIGMPLAILGIGGAAYGGYRWWKSSHEEKKPEAEQPPAPPAPPAPDGKTESPAPPAPDKSSVLVSTSSVGDVKLAAAGLRGVGNVREVTEGPDGLATSSTGRGAPDRTVQKA